MKCFCWMHDQLVAPKTIIHLKLLSTTAAAAAKSAEGVKAALGDFPALMRFTLVVCLSQHRVCLLCCVVLCRLFCDLLKFHIKAENKPFFTDVPVLPSSLPAVSSVALWDGRIIFHSTEPLQFFSSFFFFFFFYLRFHAFVAHLISGGSQSPIAHLPPPVSSLHLSK